MNSIAAAANRNLRVGHRRPRPSVANRWGIVRSAITISAIILMEEEGTEDRNGARERLEPNVVAVGRMSSSHRDRRLLRLKHEFPHTLLVVTVQSA